ncbi:MAG: hypothetical protein HND58_05975 [Planctomycetota bacterium]|nr:MAG: hypothetical protein HND58_05975 [Planctomycetota bacterium]
MDLGLNGEQLAWMVIGVVVGAVIIVAIFAEYLMVRTKTHAKTDQVMAREESRREIAAYVAEGSMSPEDAEKILAADMPVWERGFKKKA